MNENEILFYKYDLSSALHNLLNQAIEEVDIFPEDQFKSFSDNEILERIINNFKPTPIELDINSISGTREETKIDVSGDPRRTPPFGGGPIYVNGIRATISIPFKGDPQLWEMRPNKFTQTFPRGSILSETGQDQGTFVITIEATNEEGAKKIKDINDKNLNDIQFYLDAQKQQIETETSNLSERIKNAIKNRRKRLEKIDKEFTETFGIPLANQNENLKIKQKNTKSKKTNSKMKSNNKSRDYNWDIFISHASEDKEDFVRPLAKKLRLKGLKVWYDEFSLVLGDSLRRSIDKGLSKSKYGVVVISEHFLQKEWPQKELDGLTAKEVDGHKVILPIWHNIDEKAIRECSPTLADKVAISSDKGLEKVVEKILKAIK